MIVKELPSTQTLLEKAQRYPEMDVQVTEAYLYILRTGRILHDCIERSLAKSGLSYRRFLLLAFINQEKGPVAVGRLAEMSSVTPATVSDVLSGMVRDRLVERVVDPSDKRMVRIGITPEGQRVFDAALPGVFEHHKRVMAGLDDGELKTLVRLISKVHLDDWHCLKELTK